MYSLQELRNARPFDRSPENSVGGDGLTRFLGSGNAAAVVTIGAPVARGLIGTEDSFVCIGEPGADNIGDSRSPASIHTSSCLIVSFRALFVSITFASWFSTLSRRSA